MKPYNKIPCFASLMCYKTETKQQSRHSQTQTRRSEGPFYEIAWIYDNNEAETRTNDMTSQCRSP